MSAHTPGPWHFLDWGGRIVDDSVGSSQVLIATVALNTRGDESRHNARLIAAAPDMLSALMAIRAVAQQNDDGTPYAPWRVVDDCARIAIAKAAQP